MSNRFAVIAIALITACSADDGDGISASVDSPPEQRPNFLLIVADDLGYSDLGFMGSEIRTPNIDELAQSATAFRQFYAGATCSPTRTMLLTGVDHHLAGFGSMGEHLADNQRGKPGFEGHLNDRVVTLPTLLRDSGYHTYMAGKWHLGGKDGSLPHVRGFEESFALLQGGASHFSDMKRMVSIYPETVYLDNGRRVTSLPDDFYSSQHYADRTIASIDANKADGKPFFAYLSFTAPHWPLQVKDEHRDLYAGQYDQGYDRLRESRLQRMQELGLVSEHIGDVPRVPSAPAWNTLSDERRQYLSRSMEIYAAMVERVDVHVGRVIQYLHDNDLYDNTIIVFMSDNGAEGNDRTRAYDNETWLPANFDLSYENIGRIDSYAMQQAGWGQVSSVPLRFYKGYVTEGGLRVPFLIRLPDDKAGQRSSEAVATVRDVAPTLLDFAGLPSPDEEYNGREIHRASGKSLRPLLEGANSRVHDDDEAFGWELFGHRAIRKGDWKILWADGRNGKDGWQLFDVATDPRETDDLSERYPEKLTELLADWDRYVVDNNIILPEGDLGNLH